MPSVTRGFVDHVHEDPPQVDGPDPERRDRSRATQGIAHCNRGSASFARRRVEVGDAVGRVAWRETHRVVGVIGAGGVPWCWHAGAEQSTLEPPVFGPGQVLDDSCDRHVRCGQQSGRGVLPSNFEERTGCDHPVPVKALHERDALVLGLQIRVRWHNCDRPILTVGRNGQATQIAEGGLVAGSVLGPTECGCQRVGSYWSS